MLSHRGKGLVFGTRELHFFLDKGREKWRENRDHRGYNITTKCSPLELGCHAEAKAGDMSKRESWRLKLALSTCEEQGVARQEAYLEQGGHVRQQHGPGSLLALLAQVILLRPLQGFLPCEGAARELEGEIGRAHV